MRTVYINLNRRPDRRMQFEAECAKMGIQAERFSAIANDVPALGCLLSHLEVLRQARARGDERICIFEDDFEFLISPQAYNSILAAIPAEADVVMLGWYVYESAPYNDLFRKVLRATTASGYIVHSRFYDTLISNLEEAAVLFKLHINDYDVVSKYINDQYWCRLQPHATWLYTQTRVGHQRPSFSDLVGSYVTYGY